MSSTGSKLPMIGPKSTSFVCFTATNDAGGTLKSIWCHSRSTRCTTHAHCGPGSRVVHQAHRQTQTPTDHNDPVVSYTPAHPPVDARTTPHCRCETRSGGHACPRRLSHNTQQHVHNTVSLPCRRHKHSVSATAALQNTHCAFVTHLSSAR